MEISVSLPVGKQPPEEYVSWAGLEEELSLLECSGIEAIWSGEEMEIPRRLVNGYHLTFFPDWLDFYRGDEGALLQKFGSLNAAAQFYGGMGRGVLLELYRDDLARAEALGAKYVVFHVSDISIEECYTYQWLHSHEAVIDASAEIINTLLGEQDRGFDFLVENQWWPGFTFTDPALTARLMDGIRYPRKGILLDTGHLLNCNPGLRTQREGADYIHAMLDRHGALCQWIKGVHLHQSLSGEYVTAHTGALPALPKDYLEQFSVSYAHIQRIDRHQPWSDPSVRSVIDRIAPAYLTHELFCKDRTERRLAVAKQRNALNL